LEAKPNAIETVAQEGCHTPGTAMADRFKGDWDGYLNAIERHLIDHSLSPHIPAMMAAARQALPTAHMAQRRFAISCGEPWAIMTIRSPRPGAPKRRTRLAHSAAAGGCSKGHE